MVSVLAELRSGFGTRTTINWKVTTSRVNNVIANNAKEPGLKAPFGPAWPMLRKVVKSCTPVAVKKEFACCSLVLVLWVG